MSTLTNSVNEVKLGSWCFEVNCVYHNNFLNFQETKVKAKRYDWDINTREIALKGSDLAEWGVNNDNYLMSRWFDCTDCLDPNCNHEDWELCKLETIYGEWSVFETTFLDFLMKCDWLFRLEPEELHQKFYNESTKLLHVVCEPSKYNVLYRQCVISFAEKFFQIKLRLCENKTESIKIKDKKSKKIYVYFILDEENQKLKIGKTQDVKRRISNLQTANPNKLILLNFSSSLNEQEIHEKFKKHRISGEWFNYSDEIKEFVSKLRKMKL